MGSFPVPVCMGETKITPTPVYNLATSLLHSIFWSISSTFYQENASKFSTHNSYNTVDVKKGALSLISYVCESQMHVYLVLWKIR